MSRNEGYEYMDDGFVVDVIAFTHVQAANIDGGTIRHHLHAKIRSKRHVIIVDESSMVSRQSSVVVVVASLPS